MHTDETTQSIRRGGIAGIAAGPLLILSSGLPYVLPVQRPDGHVLMPSMFTGLVAMGTLGMVGVAATLQAIGSVHRCQAVGRFRLGRAGIRLAMAGSLLRVLFAVIYGLTGILRGTPLEASFLLFATGFLCLISGGVLLGAAVLRAKLLSPAALPLLLGAGSAFVAIAVVTDPWHDIALFVFDATWVAVGALILGYTRRSLPAELPREAPIS
jgi:hypothetical protein